VLQFRGNECGSLVFLEGEFRIGMNQPSDFDDAALDLLCFVQKADRGQESEGLGFSLSLG